MPAIAWMRRPLFVVGSALLVVLLAAGWNGGSGQPAPVRLARAAAPVEPRIVGGTEVPSGTYRFMAYLRIGQYLCGGSLIDATHILTAAHCVDGETAGSITAYIGGTTVSGGVPTGSLTRSASAVAMQPNYNSSTEMNDAAVITLSQAVPSAANGGIDPIGFVASGSTQGLAENQLLTVAGWGTTSSGGSLPGKLLAVDVPAQTDDYCKQQYGLSNAKSAVMFCAGPKEGGKDSCQGDSGGPIFYLDNGVYTQVGIVSWGNGCASAGYPGVYSRIAAASINTFVSGFVTSLPAPTATATATATSTPIPTPIPTAAPTDATQPDVKITAPKQGSTAGSPVTVKVSASDGQSGMASVELRRCKGSSCASLGVDAAAPWTFKKKLKPGKYDIVAIATDRAGNSRQSAKVTFTVPKLGTKAAPAAIAEPAVGAGPSHGRDRDRERERERPAKAERRR